MQTFLTSYNSGSHLSLIGDGEASTESKGRRAALVFTVRAASGCWALLPFGHLFSWAEIEICKSEDREVPFLRAKENTKSAKVNEHCSAFSRAVTSLGQMARRLRYVKQIYGRIDYF